MLESEHMTSIGGEPNVFLLDKLALELITDGLEMELLNALMGAELQEFVEETWVC